MSIKSRLEKLEKGQDGEGKTHVCWHRPWLGEVCDCPEPEPGEQRIVVEYVDNWRGQDDEH